MVDDFEVQRCLEQTKSKRLLTHLQMQVNLTEEGRTKMKRKIEKRQPMLLTVLLAAAKSIDH